MIAQVDAARRAERANTLRRGKMVARPFLAFFVQLFWNFKRFANGGGHVFTVQGSEIGRDSALLGLGVAVLWSERTAAYLFYDGEVGRSNYTSNNVSGGMRMTF